MKIFNDYAIPLYEDNVHFKDVAKALVEKIFKKNKLAYDLTDKIKKRLNKQWEGKYTNLKRFKPIDSLDTGTIEAGKAILKFYRRTRGGQEGTGLKKGKSMTMKSKDISNPINKKNTRSMSKIKKEEKKQNNNKTKTDEFKIEDISKFLEKGDTDEVKKDTYFNKYRELMNEKNIAYDRDMIIHNTEIANNQFTWFRDPNFRIEETSSEEDSPPTRRRTSKDRRRESKKFNYYNTPTLRKRSQGKYDLTKLDTRPKNLGQLRVERGKEFREHSVLLKETKLQSPKHSDLHSRRQRDLKNKKDEE